MIYPPVVVVNEQDEVVGAAPLAEAWAQGLIHRIVMVIVEDAQGRVLLHKRAPGMKLYPGRWDTVGGHVDITPSYEASARLELEEEAGLSDLPLARLAHLYCDEPYDNGVRAKRFITIFKTKTRTLAAPTYQSRSEVAETRWFTRTELSALTRKHPDHIAECLHRCLPFILKES